MTTTTIKRKLAPIALAAGLAVTGTAAATVLAAPGSPIGPAAAEAVPYKMPAGTWGRTTYYYDVHAYWHGDDQVRYRKHHRMYWNGTKWYNAVYYDGYYYSGATRA